MKDTVRGVFLLVVVCLATAPVFAAELRMTGFVDNISSYWKRNNSESAGG